MASETTQLQLATPTQGTLSGTWGDTVNNAITEYVNIAIAGTLTLTGDGAVTLANTLGNNAATNIASTTAQFAIIKVTGTLTTTKVITAPSYSKTYVVDNAATGGVVTFKAAAQTGVSVAVGEKCTVYFNGTDYVKVASSVADGVTTIDFGSTGLTPNTATSGAVSVAGTLAVLNGGTGITSFGTGIATFLGTPSSANLAAALTDETGSGSAVFATSPTLVTPFLGTPQSVTLTSATGLPLTTGVTGTLPIANGGTGTTSTTFANLTTNVTGTLPVANGGTGTTSTTFANLTTNVTGTLPVTNGGTGIATATAYGVVFAGTTATGAFQAAAGPGTATHVLTSNGAGLLPTFQAPAASGISAGKSIAFALIFGF